jgi:hypothetical protein
VWLQALTPALEALREKLRKYYSLTDPSFVYPNAVIFQPRAKLSIFNRPNWGDYGTEYNAESYSHRCRNKFVQEYENKEVESPPPILTRKRLYSAIDDEDDEYEQMLQSLNSKRNSNEYDRYISSPLVNVKISILEWWHQNEDSYPQLSQMVRDTLAVPATGAGVERQFSRSGRIMTSLRRRLSPKTVYEIMMYKNQLLRKQQELVLWKDAGANVAEEEHQIEEEDSPVLEEWRNQWWQNRSKRIRL